ncbi:AAA family ATPase [Mesomycoplasma molare]|uniref:AAA family ATPase n=1 Tax=Mesomycoplasma molare TaxID=171288 RepID=UPI0022A8D62B|nr:AAA family ATPase [Mesomycoplasma molare]
MYGTPGCGKSYYVDNVLTKNYSNKIRTTFYQDYSNTDFVGQILPIVEKERVSYEFNPGPFTLALEMAILNPNERVALIIEELNRGNASSIFGDIFQLLDRDDKGKSIYPIVNTHIIKYLNKNNNYELKEIRIPSNLSIFATMNTSDQNVFTLDTAFKRRWKYKKIINEFKQDHKFKDLYVPGADITWKDLVVLINNYMVENTDNFNNEDKQIGIYFINPKGMRSKIEIKSSDEEIEEFAYKFLEYLWSDVAKFQREKWFDPTIKTLDHLVQKYKEKGLEVFNKNVIERE